MSDRKHLTLSEFEWMQDMSRKWKRIVEAAGMFSPEMDPWNLFMLGGVISKHRTVAARRAARTSAHLAAGGNYSNLPADFSVSVLLEMTEGERAQVRADIERKYSTRVVDAKSAAWQAFS
jgi:hypothetical protein